jgi:ASC-1-like (ASCH) protein
MTIALSNRTLLNGIRMQKGNVLTLKHTIYIQQKYLDLIQSSLKTIEGRVNRSKYSKIKEGDQIDFISVEKPERNLSCSVKTVYLFKTFKEMLENLGFENCIPGVSKLDEAEKIYLSFPNYKEDEKKFGVIAFKIAVQN